MIIFVLGNTSHYEVLISLITNFYIFYLPFSFFFFLPFIAFSILLRHFFCSFNVAFIPLISSFCSFNVAFIPLISSFCSLNAVLMYCISSFHSLCITGLSSFCGSIVCLLHFGYIKIFTKKYDGYSFNLRCQGMQHVWIQCWRTIIFHTVKYTKVMICSILCQL